MHGFHVVTGQPEHHPETHEHDHGNRSATPGETGAISNWQENAATLGLTDKITYEHFEAESLPHADGHFNTVFLFDTLHHIDNRRKSLEEALRVAQQDGFVCVIEWTEQHIQKAMTEDGITIAYVDPRMILPLADISVEVITGDWYNIFILRKKAA